MSKLILNQQASAPETPAVGKAVITITTNNEIRVTDSNGNSFLFEAAPIYGTNLVIGKSQTTSSNNSTTPQSYLTVPYTISNLSATDLYEIDLSIVWSHDAGNTDYEGALYVDGVAYGEKLQVEPSDPGTDQRNWACCKFTIDGSGLQSAGNLEYRFNSSSNSNTSTTYYALIKMKRIQ